MKVYYSVLCYLYANEKKGVGYGFGAGREKRQKKMDVVGDGWRSGQHTNYEPQNGMVLLAICPAEPPMDGQIRQLSGTTRSWEWLASNHIEIGHAHSNRIESQIPDNIPLNPIW